MHKIILGKGKGRRVENGHPWVFGNEIEKTIGEPARAEIVEVYNFKNNFIGKGYINTASQITVRILTRDAQENIDKDFFRKRILSCRDYRHRLGYKNNYRLVFGEADFLPGLIIDKFNTIYVMQTVTAGMDAWKKEIAEILIDDLNASVVYERNDIPVRKLEGLEETTGFLSSPHETTFVINENNLNFEIDVARDQKTGFFLDQKENRTAIKNIAEHADVLDCFTFTGSFALTAAQANAKNITALDISEDAISRAKKNAALNSFENKIEFICANAFDVLPAWSKEGKQFDVVILDPPAFTKSRHGIHSAIKGYKEINLRAMKLIKPGGFLVTFSCSHFMAPDMFFSMLHDAAADAHKTIREVQYLTQAKDHPILWNVEETYYLKGFILQVI